MHRLCIHSLHRSFRTTLLVTPLTTDTARAATMVHAGASPSWEQMWAAGLQPGQAFDVGSASATLLGCLSRGSYAGRTGMRALVPGCGRAYDALALVAHGFDEVVALDLAPTAVQSARAFLAASEDAGAARVTCVEGDFFEHAGTYDFIWDCTFLCALDPSVRMRWAERTRTLLAPDGVLAACVFPIAPNKVGGPPFALSPQLLKDLLEPTGLKCEVVEVDDSERHVPGAMKGGNLPGTALLLARPAASS